MNRALNRFLDDTVVVTGAASGIGLATARRFLEEGARVVLVDRDQEALARAMEQPGLQVYGSDHAVPVVADISVPDDVEALRDLCRARFGSVQVLVNNAGVTAGGTILDGDLATWERVCATVLTGTINMSRLFLPLLIETRGSIVNVASVSGIGGDWNTAYYNVAKAGVVNLTRVMAMDHGHLGVRVNAICPAVTRTGMTQEALKDGAFVEALKARIPLRRVGEPEDMAAAIAFLASSDATFITGLNMPVDGGVTASNGQPPFPM